MQQPPNQGNPPPPWPEGQEPFYPPQGQTPPPAWTPVAPPHQPQRPLGQVPPPAALDPLYGAPVIPPPFDNQPGGAPYGQIPPQAPVPQGVMPPFQDFMTPEPAANEQKPGYRTPKTGIPRGPKRKRFKPIYLLLLLLALVFAGFAIVKMLAPGDAMYGYVLGGTLSSRYTGDALIVRNETVYTQEGISQIDYIAEEGANVSRTSNICTVYTSGFNTRELTTLQKYRNQIKDYHKVLIADSQNDPKLTTLDTQVRDRAEETRRLVQGAHGNLINQEALLTLSMQARQTYLKQKYPDDQKLARLYDDENTQMQRISSWTKQYAAASDGLVSFYTDGYEAALNLSNYAEYTPAHVRGMYNGRIPANPAVTKNTVSIYRLVKNEGWAVLMLANEMDWTPVVGRTYKLLIESFENTVVDATVESFTRSGGELLVRLSVADADVKNVLYIRSCRVQLGENVDSLTVPTRALYSQNGQIGVVLVDEQGNNYWTPVTLISTEGDSAHIIPNNPGYLYEGMLVKLF